MSEQNQRNNSRQQLSPDEPEEMLPMRISVVTLSLAWIGVIGNLQVALRQEPEVMTRPEEPSRAACVEMKDKTMALAKYQRMFMRER